MVWANNMQKGIVVTRAVDHQAPLSPQSSDSSHKKARFFWRRSAGSDESDKSDKRLEHRESFQCMDSKAIEEAFASSRDRYEAASIKQTAAPLRPCRLEMHDTGPLLGALNQRAHVLQQREQQLFRQQAASSLRRPETEAGGNAAQKQVPPVPPLPEQYRHMPSHKI